MLLFFFVSCKKENKDLLFKKIPADKTKVDFINEVKDTKELNILDYLYFYNGGGVTTGDINNDGLTDIYFTSNLGKNKLYLNKGNFEFEDITKGDEYFVRDGKDIVKLTIGGILYVTRSTESDYYNGKLTVSIEEF